MSSRTDVLAYLRAFPHSTARQVTRGLGLAGNRYQVAETREHLERLERAGHVQRTKAGANNSPWRWEAV